MSVVRCLSVLLLATIAGATTYNCVSFSVPGASSTMVNGINNSGILSGSYVAAGVTHGFIGSAGNFQTVDYPGATNTQLFTINNNGVTVGEYNFNVQGKTPGWFTRDSAGNFTPVAISSGYTISILYGINDNGAISGVVIPANQPPLSPLSTLTAA